MIPVDEDGVPKDSEVLDGLERVKMGLNQLAELEADDGQRYALSGDLLEVIQNVARASYSVGLRDGAEADMLARLDDEERRDMFVILKKEDPTLEVSLWGRKNIMGGLQLVPMRERAQTWLDKGLIEERRDEWDVYPVVVTRRKVET